MTRYENWPTLLLHFVDSLDNQKFNWGKNDCFIFCGGAIQAMTGDDIFKGYKFKGKYDSAAGAIKQFKKHNFKTLESVWSHFLTPVAVAFAQRGDVVLKELENEKMPACGIVLDQRSVFLAPEGLTYLPTLESRLAFQVGS